MRRLDLPQTTPFPDGHTRDFERRLDPVESMHATSTFVDAAAVEAWGTWFRWRDGGVLKDLSIETTWRRVATCLAGSQTTRAGSYFHQSLLVAFSRWRLLLDERILATAGTGVIGWPNDGLVAVLNAAAFVSGGHSGHARFEMGAFAETAELAVKALDAAAACAPGQQPESAVLRIGIIGLADAFARLDIPYDSQKARSLGSEIGRALARGSLLGAIRAAQGRNDGAAAGSSLLESALHRGFERDIGSHAKKAGLPYASLTAITSQPRLALFANNVTGSIGPIASIECRCAGNDAADAMRRALQPWVDEPIADTVCRSRQLDTRRPATRGDR